MRGGRSGTVWWRGLHVESVATRRRLQAEFRHRHRHSRRSCWCCRSGCGCCCANTSIRPRCARRRAEPPGCCRRTLTARRGSNNWCTRVSHPGREPSSGWRCLHPDNSRLWLCRHVGRQQWKRRRHLGATPRVWYLRWWRQSSFLGVHDDAPAVRLHCQRSVGRTGWECNNEPPCECRQSIGKWSTCAPVAPPTPVLIAVLLAA